MDNDPLYQEAKDVSVKTGYVSASNLQRQMRIGYLRAVRLMEALAEEGFCEKEYDAVGHRRLIDKVATQVWKKDEFPRRARIDLFTPEELAIYNAMGEVEKLGAHPLLTDVVVLLGEARGKLADWIDLQSGK